MLLYLYKQPVMDFAKYINEKILFKNKENVLRVHLYTKLLEKGNIPYEKDLDVLIALYVMGGYNNGEEQQVFFKICLDKEFKRSIQSLRNTLSKYTELGVLTRPKNQKRYVSEQWLPKDDTEKLVLDYKISHN